MSAGAVLVGAPSGAEKPPRALGGGAARASKVLSHHALGLDLVGAGNGIDHMPKDAEHVCNDHDTYLQAGAALSQGRHLPNT